MKKLSALFLFGAVIFTTAAVAEEESLATAIFTPFRQKEIVPVDNKQYKD